MGMSITELQREILDLQMNVRDLTSDLTKSEEENVGMKLKISSEAGEDSVPTETFILKNSLADCMSRDEKSQQLIQTLTEEVGRLSEELSTVTKLNSMTMEENEVLKAEASPVEDSDEDETSQAEPNPDF